MSQKQLKQAHVLRNFNAGMLSRKEAAEALGLSERQISRKAKGMKETQEISLLHKNKGRKPRHALQEEIKEEILKIRRESVYMGCNISHFRDILERDKRIKISYKALYNLLNAAGISSPKKHSRATKAHRRRKRKSNAGELLQIDATPYEWFGGDAQPAVHGSIDDATGRLTGLYMTENECLNGYFEVMRQTILREGVPLTLYSDRHTIFRSPKTAEKESHGEEAKLTQFGRAMEELGINVIHARTPQAKGRIERVWGTLQSRLPIELRIRGITTIEAANEFLTNEYIEMFNEQFSIEAESGSMFVTYTHSEPLDHILCIKETRTIDNAGVLSFKNQTFRVLDEGYPLIPAKAKVTVLTSTRCAVQVQYKERIFKTVVCEKPLKAAMSKCNPKQPENLHERVVVQLRHGTDEWRKIWHTQPYEESMRFLYEIFLKNNSLFA